jgi:hypothetical protein
MLLYSIFWVIVRMSGCLCLIVTVFYYMLNGYNVNCSSLTLPTKHIYYLYIQR